MRPFAIAARWTMVHHVDWPGAATSFGPMMSRRTACPPPLDAVECAYAQALRGLRGSRLSAHGLVLLGVAGDTLVALERAR